MLLMTHTGAHSHERSFERPAVEVGELPSLQDRGEDQPIGLPVSPGKVVAVPKVREGEDLAALPEEAQ
jgi:hypothetical protein